MLILCYYHAVNTKRTYCHIFLLFKEAHSNIIPKRNRLRQELCSDFILGESNIKILVILKVQEKYNHTELVLWVIVNPGDKLLGQHLSNAVISYFWCSDHMFRITDK